MRAAFAFGDYALAQFAEYFGVHNSTVSGVAKQER